MHILRNIVFLFVLFLNKLYEAIITRKIQNSMGVSKFTTPDTLGHYTFFYRINTSGVKNRLLLIAVNNSCKMLHHRCLTGSEYAAVSDFE